MAEEFLSRENNIRLVGSELGVQHTVIYDPWTRVWSQVHTINTAAAILCVIAFIIIFCLWRETNNDLKGRLLEVASQSYALGCALEVNRRITAAYCGENIGKMYGVENREVFQILKQAQMQRLAHMKQVLGISDDKPYTGTQQRFLEKAPFVVQGYWMYWALAKMIVYPEPIKPEEENTLSFLSDMTMPNL